MGSAAQQASAAFGRISDLLEHVDYRLAETPEEKEEIYRLRYRAYLREGAIEPSADERVADRYDDWPNTWIFGIHLHGELHSSIRISVLTPEWQMSPSVETFGDILQPRLDQGQIIVDPTRFVADPEKARRLPELPYVTVRLAYLACEFFKADIGLAIVRAEHQAFYRRVFLHETLAEPRVYPGLLKPVGLMATDFRRATSAVREKFFRRYPFMRSSAFERRMLFGERHSPSPDAVVSRFEPTSIVPS